MPSDLHAHLHVDRYGDFWLTQAIRPGLRLPIVPRQGYRAGLYRDRKIGLRVPVLAAQVSRERLFETFLDLLTPLGPVVDVVLESSHDCHEGGHRDLCRQYIDLPVLESHFCDFEELLLHDGCTGAAVIATTGPAEVQFDEHKLLIVYARDLAPFEQVLKAHGIVRDDGLQLISEAEHLHQSEPHWRQAFDQLCSRAGVVEGLERVSW